MKSYTFEINLSCRDCLRFGTSYETIREDRKFIYVGCAKCKESHKLVVYGVYETRYRTVPGSVEIHLKRLP